MTTNSQLDYDIVIATRNRQGMLKMSIPLMLGQSAPPRKLIVVDSSDDHQLTRESVHTAASDWIRAGGIVEIVQSSTGLCHQRNKGLQHVESSVVMFPDDDALWHPGVAAAITEVYQRDSQRRIAAVCGGAVVERSPVASHNGTLSTRSLRRWIGAQAWAVRGAVEKRVVDPFLVYGRSLCQRASLPSWCAEMGVVPTPYMVGYRMSFRTEVVRQHGFEKAFKGYSLFEDVDASFAAARYGFVVAARGAKIFHHQAPGRRGDAREIGFTQLLNRAYIVLKHVEDEAAYRLILLRFLQSKIARYLLRATSAYGRRQFLGALDGYVAAKKLSKHPRHARRAAYEQLLTELRARPQSSISSMARFSFD
jgi:glycosyltransferase involved in cell wall biosynthesis